MKEDGRGGTGGGGGSAGQGKGEEAEFAGYVRFGYVNSTEIVRQGLEELRRFMREEFERVPLWSSSRSRRDWKDGRGGEVLLDGAQMRWLGHSLLATTERECTVDLLRNGMKLDWVSSYLYNAAKLFKKPRNL